MQHVHCFAKLRHWNLISLVDTSVGYKNEARMCLNLIFAADSADGVKRHTQIMVATSVRSIQALISLPRSCNK